MKQAKTLTSQQHEEKISKQRKEIFKLLDKGKTDTALPLIEQYLDAYNPLDSEMQMHYIGTLISLERSSEALDIVTEYLVLTSPYTFDFYAQIQQFFAFIREHYYTSHEFLRLCQNMCDSAHKQSEKELQALPLILTAFVTLLTYGEKGAKEALTLLDKAYSNYLPAQDNYLARFTEGLALAHLGRTDEGTAAFEAVYEEGNATTAIPHLDMANICSTGGSIYLAQQYYKKAETCSDFNDEMAASIGDFFFSFGLHKYTAYWYAKVQDAEIRPQILPALAYAYYKLTDARMLDTLHEAILIDPLATQEVFKTEFTVNDATELLEKVKA
ncbi:MAG: hypothetical protein Q4A44_04845 [Bacteroidales bacterium]|nr:hypothetical protein [Bacteroidales bacterium]